MRTDIVIQGERLGRGPVDFASSHADNLLLALLTDLSLASISHIDVLLYVFLSVQVQLHSGGNCRLKEIDPAIRLFFVCHNQQLDRKMESCSGFFGNGQMKSISSESLLQVLTSF